MIVQWFFFNFLFENAKNTKFFNPLQNISQRGEQTPQRKLWHQKNFRLRTPKVWRTSLENFSSEPSVCLLVWLSVNRANLRSLNCTLLQLRENSWDLFPFRANIYLLGGKFARRERYFSLVPGGALNDRKVHCSAGNCSLIRVWKKLEILKLWEINSVDSTIQNIHLF